MFCSKCGSSLDDKAVICPNCGTGTENLEKYKVRPKEEKNGMAIAGFVCSFIIPILGWIFGGIGLSRANQRDGKGKGFSIAAIAIASVNFILGLILQA